MVTLRKIAAPLVYHDFLLYFICRLYMLLLVLFYANVLLPSCAICFEGGLMICLQCMILCTDFISRLLTGKRIQ